MRAFGIRTSNTPRVITQMIPTTQIKKETENKDYLDTQGDGFVCSLNVIKLRIEKEIEVFCAFSFKFIKLKLCVTYNSYLRNLGWEQKLSGQSISLPFTYLPTAIPTSCPIVRFGLAGLKFCTT